MPAEALRARKPSLTSDEVSEINDLIFLLKGHRENHCVLITEAEVELSSGTKVYLSGSSDDYGNAEFVLSFGG